MYSNSALFDKAVEITKEYARSEGTTPVHVVLKNIYEELKKLNGDLNS